MNLVKKLIPKGLRAGMATVVNKRTLARLRTDPEPMAAIMEEVVVRLRDREGNEAIDAVEGCRKQLAARHESIYTGEVPLGPFDRDDMTVSFVSQASKPPLCGLLLHLLVRCFDPKHVLELGTNLGISSSFQATALNMNGPEGKMLTLDASPCRNKVAREVHGLLKLNNVDYRVGIFADTLAPAVEESEPFDFVFIDGHHEFDPTVDYVNTIWSNVTERSVFVFDDIRWTADMLRFWNHFQQDPRVTMAVDFKAMGVCLMSKNKSSSPPSTYTFYNLL